jgi:hypothetical protein
MASFAFHGISLSSPREVRYRLPVKDVMIDRCKGSHDTEQEEPDPYNLTPMT